jgi:hypothetical protein
MDSQGPLVVDGFNLTLTSERGGATIDAMSQSRIFDVLNGGRLHATKITLQGGRADRGGAVYAVKGSGSVLMGDLVYSHVALYDCIIRDCRVFSEKLRSGGRENEIAPGGALYLHGSNATLERCSIANCSVEAYHRACIGGGIACRYYSAVSLSGCFLANCTATTGSSYVAELFGGVGGGAVHVSEFSTAVLKDSTIRECSAERSSAVIDRLGAMGGAIRVDVGDIILRRCAIDRCHARAELDKNAIAMGGAVYVSGNDIKLSLVTLEDCTFSHCEAAANGRAAGGAISAAR